MSNQIARQEQSGGIATNATFADARAASDALRAYAEQFNLVSPATSVGALPDGCEIVVGHVFVDTRTEERKKRNGDAYIASVSGDIYHTEGGRWGLSKTVLNRIASAAGVKWHLSQRMDDGSHPFYVHWYVEGNYRSFDGASHTINGSKIADLRDGSPQAVKARDGLGQARSFIGEMAESKAKLRAIKDAFGIKGGYSIDELKKPFVTARIMFTGRSEDAETQRMFSRAIAASFLDSSHSLYSAPARAPEPPRLAPPPVDTTADDSGSWDTSTGARRDAPAQEPARKPAPESVPDVARGRPERSAQAPQASNHVIPGGTSKGTPLDKASDRDLEYWAGRIDGDLASGNARNPERDRPLLAALQAEINRRRGSDY